jgi:hypothetical protein
MHLSNNEIIYESHHNNIKVTALYYTTPHTYIPSHATIKGVSPFMSLASKCASISLLFFFSSRRISGPLLFARLIWCSTVDSSVSDKLHTIYEI